MGVRLDFDVNKVKVVDITDVRPNTYNPKEKDTAEYQKIKKILQQRGQTSPVIVRDNDGYEIIDGEQRWTALSELGATKIIIYDLGKVADQDAVAITLEYEQKVPFDEIPLAKLLVTMYEEYPGLQLPYTEEEILDYRNMLNFDWTSYNATLEENTSDEPDAEIKDTGDKKSIIIRLTKEQFEVLVRSFDGKKNQYMISKIMEAVTN